MNLVIILAATYVLSFIIFYVMIKAGVKAKTFDIIMKIIFSIIIIESVLFILSFLGK